MSFLPHSSFSLLRIINKILHHFRELSCLAYAGSFASLCELFHDFFF